MIRFYRCYKDVVKIKDKARKCKQSHYRNKRTSFFSRSKLQMKISICLPLPSKYFWAKKISLF